VQTGSEEDLAQGLKRVTPWCGGVPILAEEGPYGHRRTNTRVMKHSIQFRSANTGEERLLAILERHF